MTSIEIDGNGFLRANFDTGITRVLYQIPLADVPNPNGLRALDNQTYALSNDSGSFFLWDAGDGPTGDIVGFALEESATDVAGELTSSSRRSAPIPRTRRSSRPWTRCCRRRPTSSAET
jgi:flagellar hook protein FlgE